MLDALVQRWKQWRASGQEPELERAEKESGEVESPGPGGWTPIGDVSKLSEDD